MLAISNYEVAIFDLDGTLIDESGSKFEDIDIGLDNLLSKGLKIILATGRSVPSIKSIKEKYSFFQYFYPKIVCNDGNTIYDTYSEHVITLNFLNRNFFREFYAQTKDRAGVVIEAGGKLFADSREAKTKMSMLYKEIGRSSITQIDFHQLQSLEISEIHVFPIHESILLDIFYPGSKIKSLNFFNCIKIIPEESCKSNGVIYLLNELGYHFSQAIAFGDSLNDCNLLKQSQIGVAVENSVSELVQIADIHLNGPIGAFLCKL